MCQPGWNLRIRVAVVEFVKYKTFEVLPLYVCSGAFACLVVSIYRPQSASSVTEEFFSELANVLERCSSYDNCIVVGDINVHFDDCSSPHTDTLMSLFDSFGMCERVCQPTHVRHHQLDVFITRSDQPTPTIRVDLPGHGHLSNHSLIVASLTSDVTDRSSDRVQRPRVLRRRWRNFDLDTFVDDLCRSPLVIDPPLDVHDQFDLYDSMLHQLLDKHAPLVEVTLYARPAAPWFKGQDKEARADVQNTSAFADEESLAAAVQITKRFFSIQVAGLLVSGY